MSIIIVGVGDEDFSQMRQLDSDASLLQMGTRIAKRDIVNFIELKEEGKEVKKDKAELAKEALQEISQQVTDWMYMRQFAAPVEIE